MLLFRIQGMICLLLVGVVCFSMPAHAATKAIENIAFYYGDSVPVDELAMFEKVVVEPGYLKNDVVNRLKKGGAQVFAYVSMGEARRERPWFGDTNKAWQIGENKAWNSAIMDLANEQWQAFIIHRLVAPLVAQGYDGLFLDTLDSYQLIFDDPSRQMRQQQGLVHLIARLHEKFPTLKLLLNRGFEVAPSVYRLIDGVVAESLFRTWNPAAREYAAVKRADQQWLMTTLTRLRQSYHLPVYVIDYVAPGDRKLARETARKIADLGFVPWVSNPGLNMLGISNLEIVPRRIMVLYDSQEGELPYSEAHRFLAAPVEYMGYVLDYQDVRQALPGYTLTGRYAGILSWLTDEALNSPRRLTRWLTRQMNEGVPVALFHSFGLHPEKAFLKRLGVAKVQGKIQRPLRIVHADDMAHMETRPRALARGLFPMQAVDPYVQVHESIEDARGKRMDVVITAPWGGVALAPYVMEIALDEHARWRLDVFKFIRQALHLKPMPIFDTTTENGFRLLMTHIDGDGAASRAVMPGSPLAIRVIRDEILRRYKVPATVSVITSELETDGLFPKRAAEMQKVARSIFALPYVEIASHTYSHPFSWAHAASDPHAHLNIPGYHYSIEQEVAGSVNYINRHLAPRGKKVKVFLWSGDALPDEKALQLAASMGLRNMNGGNTVATHDHPSLTDVSSMIRPVGRQLQVYAPVMNENIYTHNWTKPRYGFERVIETFKLTDRPRRLKPIDIYYHFYSGSELASLNALKRVYDWSLKQEVLPLWVSEYADKVKAYDHAVAAVDFTGTWHLKASAALKTIRIDKRMGWPDIQHAGGVAGVRQLPQGRYVHLSGKGKNQSTYTLRFQPHAPNVPYLIAANVPLQHWRLDGKRVRMRLSGHMPVRFTLNRRCELIMGREKVMPVKHGSVYRFVLSRKDTGDALLSCR